MKSDKGLLDFLKSFGMSKVVAVLIIGAALIFIGGASTERDDSREAVAVTLDEQVAEMCSSVEGVGECRVMITYTEDGEVFAVAVLCEGAQSTSVRKNVTDLVASLFGIGANRISVLKIKE